MQRRNSSKRAGKMPMTSCQAKTKSKRQLPPNLHRQERVLLLVGEVNHNEEAEELQHKEVDRAREADLNNNNVVVVSLLLEARAILLVPVVAEVAQLLRKIGLSGSAWCNIYGKKNYCLPVSSYSRRNAVRKMPTLCPLSTSAQQPRGVQST